MSDGQGVGEADYPPGFFGNDYVPDNPGETTQTPAPLPPDSDLAVTGVDPTTGMLVALVLIPAGIAATIGAYYKGKKAKA